MSSFSLLCLFFLLVPIANALTCYNYAYYPIDGSYYEKKVRCPTNFCVDYSFKMWRGRGSRMTFFAGNCDEAHLCTPTQKSFNMTLNPEDYRRIFGQNLPMGVTKIQVAGKCCNHTTCNVFRL